MPKRTKNSEDARAKSDADDVAPVEPVYPPVVSFLCRHEDCSSDRYNVAVSRFSSAELLELKRYSNAGEDFTYGHKSTPLLIRELAVRLGWCYPIDDDAPMPAWFDTIEHTDPTLGEDIPPHHVYAVISGLDAEPM